MVCSERAIAAAAVGGFVVVVVVVGGGGGGRGSPIDTIHLDSSWWRFNGCPPHSTYIYERD
jgi:hypothetical protein